MRSFIERLTGHFQLQHIEVIAHDERHFIVGPIGPTLFYCIHWNLGHDKIPIVTKHIIHLIEQLGFRVSVHRMRGGISLSGRELPVPDLYIEMHAIMPGEPAEVKIVRIDSHGQDAEHRCASELAIMIGVDLQDG